MFARMQLGRAAQGLRTVRKLHHKVQNVEQDVTEVVIPVPWGKITGKWWGSMDKQPILALHGWQDNSGSFDPLVPQLPKNTSFLAIDLPGHGFSDGSPPGIPYSLHNGLLLIRRIVNYYGWENVKLLGHSMGATFIYLYASYFSKETKFVVALDCLKPPSLDIDAHSELFLKRMADFLKMESQLNASEPPGYTEEGIIERWTKATNHSLDETACKILMARGVSRKPDGKYFFHRDPRLKSGSIGHNYTHEHLLNLASKIVCPYLVVKATKAPYFEKKKNFYDTVEILKKSSTDFQMEKVIGKHHVHLTNPDRVSSIINPFLEKYDV